MQGGAPVPATKYLRRTVILGFIGLSLSSGSLYADNCESSSVNLMHITGEEDLSAMGQVVSLAGTTTHSGHVWESSRTARVQLAARSARVGAYAPQTISQVAPESSTLPSQTDSHSSIKPVSKVNVDTSSSTAGARTISRPQTKTIKVQVIKKLR